MRAGRERLRRERCVLREARVQRGEALAFQPLGPQVPAHALLAENLDRAENVVTTAEQPAVRERCLSAQRPRPPMIQLQLMAGVAPVAFQPYEGAPPFVAGVDS